MRFGVEKVVAKVCALAKKKTLLLKRENTYSNIQEHYPKPSYHVASLYQIWHPFQEISHRNEPEAKGDTAKRRI